MRTDLDAVLLRDWANAALQAVGAARAEIDALNVFPVPDGDTGTNLYLTLESAVQAAAGVPDDDLRAIARALNRGALLGARGNSGVILSQLIRGVTGVTPAVGTGRSHGGEAFRQALQRAAELAYAGVAAPVEGTILTVARLAAEAADQEPSDDLCDVVTAAANGAREALARTPDLLPALRAAGVVDAGGRGLVVILDAFVEVVTGVHRAEPVVRLAVPRPAVQPYAGPAYEVMFLLEAADAAIPPMRQALADLGDSLLVVGGEGLWNVHVHVDDPGAAVEAGIAAGRPYRIRITWLSVDMPQASGQGRGLVVVAHGPGVAALLERAGAVVVPAAPRVRPSTAELLDGIARAGTAEVVILPSDRDTVGVAEVAAERARADGLRVSVIPTRAVVQSLAALAVHEPGARFDDDVVAMTRAAGATRYAAVTVAAKAGVTSAGVCAVGDILGLVDGDIVEIGADVGDVAAAVLARLLGAGGELVTFVLGSDAPPALADRLAAFVRAGHPGLEVIELDGGQPLWPVIVGVE